MWAAGFAADLAGAALLLASYLLWCLADMRGWVQGDAFAQALLTNPRQHPLALVLTLAALALAVLTAPYVYLVPLAWWWGH